MLLIPSTSKCDEPIIMIDSGGHTAHIEEVMFTNDGKSLISASTDKTIRIWDLKSGSTAKVIRGEIGSGASGEIYATAISHDNKYLAAGGLFTGDPEHICAIRLYDYHSGKLISLLKGHKNFILSLKFSADGKYLISGSNDNTAHIWDVQKRQPLHILNGHTAPIYGVDISPDNHRAVTASHDNTLILWDVKTGNIITTMAGHKDKVNAVSFTPDGKNILSGSSDYTIRLWDGVNGKFIKQMAKSETMISGLSISPDGLKVITGNDYPIYLNYVFNIPSGKMLSIFAKNKAKVTATAISPDSATSVTGGGKDNEIYLWDINAGKINNVLQGKGKTIWAVGFGRDGKSIAFGKSNVNPNIFNRGPLEQSFNIKDDPSIGNILNDEKDYIRAVEKVGSISIRTKNADYHPTLLIYKGKEIIQKINRNFQSGFDHRGITLTHDGNMVISGGGNGALASYDTTTGKKIRDFIGHSGEVWSVSVSLDNKLLVSGSDDQTIKIWNINSGGLLITIFIGSDNEWVAWTPQGFYTSSENGGKYLGWQVNRGAENNADFYTAESLSSTLKRPDIIKNTLQFGSSEMALVKAGLKNFSINTLVHFKQ